MITPEHIQNIVRERTAMLRNLSGTIGAALFRAIEQKIEYEHSSLIAIMESETKKAFAQKELNKVLSSEYFVQKRMSADIL